MATEKDVRRAIDECAKQDMKEAQQRGKSLTHEQARKVWEQTARQDDRKKNERK